MLELKAISKSLEDFSLNNVTFSVAENDYFVLLGESGAGKSMVLETIAGLVSPESGSVFLEGKDITSSKIQDRSVGLVFQDHAIFPHLTVSENIGYSLHGAKMTHGNKKMLIERLADSLEIRPLLFRKPSSLSGGELQRVALARTLVQKPRVLLLDEPLASLDARLKADLRALLRRIHREGQTILHVTHDYEEAIALATRIAVIRKGTIIQEGFPADVFHHPKNEFIANFIGVKNFFPVTLVRHNGDTFAKVDENFLIRITSGEKEGEGFVMIRGEDIILSLSELSSSATNGFRGVVKEVVASPMGMEVCVDAGLLFFALVTSESVNKLGISEGVKAWIHFKATAVKFIKA